MLQRRMVMKASFSSSFRFQPNSSHNRSNMAAVKVVLLQFNVQVGASPHASDKKLRTPLMRATKRCHSDVAILLVQRGALCDTRVRRELVVFDRVTHELVRL